MPAFGDIRSIRHPHRIWIGDPARRMCRGYSGTRRKLNAPLPVRSGRLDRSGKIASGRSCRTVTPTERTGTPSHWGQARSSAVGRVAITAMRSFLRINGSPRKTASPTISGSAGESPCMSGHCGFGRLQPPATVGLCPARLRLRALGLELKRFPERLRRPAASTRRMNRRDRDTCLSGPMDPR